MDRIDTPPRERLARGKRSRGFPSDAAGKRSVRHRKQGDCHDIGNDASRAHWKAAWHQTRKRLDLETYLRRDWRDVAGPHYRGHSWPDEAHQAASGESRRIVRLEQDRTSITQRDSQPRLANAADRSADLPFL